MGRIQHNFGLSFESKAPRVILHTGMGEFYSKMIGREGVRSFAPPDGRDWERRNGEVPPQKG